MREIPLFNSALMALVDDEDEAHVLALGPWSYVECPTSYPRVQGKFQQRTIFLHRAVLGLKPGDPDVDHRNRNGLDNRRENLRLATKSQNGMNQGKQRRDTSSQFKGVSFHKGPQKWCAYITVNGKKIGLGHYDTEIEGARAYNIAAREHFVEFALFNDVPDPFLVPHRSCHGQGASKYKGVHWVGGTRGWQATYGTERTSLGFYDSEELAARAYDKVARQHGRPTNFSEVNHGKVE